MISRFRSLYGASPLHLLVLLACFVIAGAGAAGWYLDSSDWHGVVEWFVAAMVVCDLVLFPLSSLVDRIVFLRARRAGAENGLAAAVPRRRALVFRVSAIPYVRVPALLSGLLLITFAPVILRRASLGFQQHTGNTNNVYVGRWLAITAVLFGLSALAYAFSVWRARAAGPQ
jgi:hypothetical protein